MINSRDKEGLIVKAKNSTQKLAVAALLAALTCVVTMVIKIPSPLKGYLNLGDCVVLTASRVLSPLYGFLAAGLGSALADIFSGYAIYAPATFLIKGLMSLAAYCIYKALNKKINNPVSHIISGFVAEVIMVLGYYVFEGFMYGFGESLANVAANAVQGAAGLILGFVLIKIFEKTKISFN